MLPDREGKQRLSLMGSPGIGSEGPLAAPVIEAIHDEAGVWPRSLAPHDVYIVAIQPD